MVSLLSQLKIHSPNKSSAKQGYPLWMSRTAEAEEYEERSGGGGGE